MKNRTIKEIKNYIKKELFNLYDNNEIVTFSFLIFEHLLKYTKIQYHANNNVKVDDTICNKIKDIVDRLKKNEPIQYILGHMEFYDLKINVNPHILIPRPETEELTDLIIKNEKQIGLQIIDIGTGSGCIAIALAKNLSNAQIDAVDISEDALITAKENAEMNNVHVSFFRCDISKEESLLTGEKYDIIVSNPPYVKNSEKSKMKKNVLDYEPHTALFVSDENPLLFYKYIITFAIEYLKNGGRVYVEINEALGNETKALFEKEGFDDVRVIKDLNNKERFIKAVMLN